MILIGGQLALVLNLQFEATWHTPIMWTGYILFVDGLLAKLRGQSWLTKRRLEFPFLILMSVLIWLLFEIYNLRLQNWLYRGLPSDPGVLDLGYFWSFATILPGILISAELVGALFPVRRNSSTTGAIRLGPDWIWILIGIAMLTIPLMLPIPIARFTFGFVWIGFIPFIDPINYKLRAPNLRTLLTDRNWRPVVALLLGGLLCGLLWEAWNFQALRASGGHWIYTVPETLRIFGWHYGQMPVLGMLGFPPFALELYVLYQFMRRLFNLEKFFGPWEISTR